jgi:hypothetical protein
MGDRVWQVSQEEFIEAWTAAESLDEVAERLKKLTGGHVPRWAAMVRAMSLRKDGREMKSFASS